MTKLQKCKAGIYRIVDLEGREYIGSSVDVRRRKYQHFYYLENNKHHSHILQESYNKNGKEYFKFEVLEYCDEKELLAKEKKRLESLPHYNISGCALGASEETRKRMSLNHADVSGENNPMWKKKASIAVLWSKLVVVELRPRAASCGSIFREDRVYC